MRLFFSDTAGRAFIGILSAIAFAWAALTLNSANAQEERTINAPFSTLEDGVQIGKIDIEKKFGWLYQKPFIAKIVEDQLLKRDFEPKTAEALAQDWDGLRYDIETGELLFKSRPDRITAEEAIGFAQRLPGCLSDFGNSQCNLQFASELGCRLDGEILTQCQRNYAIARAQFTRKPKYSLYSTLACLLEGGKGADLPVFDAKEIAAASKLKFLAAKDSKNVTATVKVKPNNERVPLIASAYSCRSALRPDFRINKKFYGKDSVDFYVKDARDDIKDIINDVKAAYRRGESVDDMREAANNLGIEWRDSPKLTLIPVPEAGLGVIDDFRLAWIGIHINREDEIDWFLPTSDNPRPVVSEVVVDGPAAKGGMMAGDRIVKFGNQVVEFAVPFDEAERDAVIGKPIEISIDRLGRTIRLSIIPSAIEDAAKDGNTLAMRSIGRFYFSIGDYEVAQRWFEKGALRGDIVSMLQLTRLYFGNQYGPFYGRNKEFPLNEKLGQYWLEKAADDGHCPSMMNLGLYVQHGNHGFNKDIVAARNYLMRAKAAGCKNVDAYIAKLN